MGGVSDFNAKIIKEFRDNAGKVGGPFAGAPMLILHTRGAKSGKERLNPLVYSRDNDRYIIAASKGGAPSNPDWYHNVVKQPSVSIEAGTEKFDVDAAIITGDERDRLYAEHGKLMPAFLEYEKKTKRKIPVIALTRKK